MSEPSQYGKLNKETADFLAGKIKELEAMDVRDPLTYRRRFLLLRVLKAGLRQVVFLGENKG